LTLVCCLVRVLEKGFANFRAVPAESPIIVASVGEVRSKKSKELN